MENGLYVAKVDGDSIHTFHADADALADASTAKMFAAKKQAEAEAAKTASKAEQPKPKQLPADALREPVKAKPTEMDRLRSCAKSTCLCAVVSAVVFYWQEAGLMATEASFPTLLVMALLAGFWIGKALK